MKKFLKLLIFIIIFISLTIIIRIIKDNEIISTAAEGNQQVEEENSKSGMRITMVAGVALPENGDLNSNSYLIRTKNDKLIVVDGGEDGDTEFLLKYIMEYGGGTVNYWYITHPHQDHVGALCQILNSEENNIKIENLYYSFNNIAWYKKNDKRGYESELAMITALSSNKIINKIECKRGKIINMDNIECEILRVANPKITNSDNGNESSMVFKMTAKDVDKSMLFLGDAYKYASEELLEEPEKLKSYAVQMAHHGQNGVTKDIYDKISPKLCFFNAPKWLYDDNNGNGYDSGNWQSLTVRKWVEEYNADSICAFEGDKTIRLTKDGYEILDENNEVKNTDNTNEVESINN